MLYIQAAFKDSSLLVWWMAESSWEETCHSLGERWENARNTDVKVCRFCGKILLQQRCGSGLLHHTGKASVLLLQTSVA